MLQHNEPKNVTPFDALIALVFIAACVMVLERFF